MYLNNIKFSSDYLCVRNLVIHSDTEYGYHIYYRHAYKDIEFSYYTEYENLSDIINELLEKIIIYENNLNNH